jgi:signal transduction histidine kinase
MVRGLARRMLFASAAVALVIATAFVVLLQKIDNMSRWTKQVGDSQEILATSQEMERLIIEVETGERGFLLTAEESYLGPWRVAQVNLPPVGAKLQQLARLPVPADYSRRLVQEAASYLKDYSIPLVSAARAHDPSARALARLDEGNRRVEQLEADFDGLDRAEQQLVVSRRQRVLSAGRIARVALVTGLAGSLMFIVLFAIYLSRAMVRPIRRAATMARTLADGDLSARMPETGVGEIGALEKSFNVMARTLEVSRIANSDARAQLAASRTRIVTATDQARRKIERDLHDGTQQRLVSLALDLRTAESQIPPELPRLRSQLDSVVEGLSGAMNDLREISRGIHPAILSEGGLGAALKALARRSAIPVQVDVQIETRIPPSVEIAAYYVVAESLANSAKHARASIVTVDGRVEDHVLQLSISDDGVGGADPAKGSGLVGLIDRVEALGGTITLISPQGNGCTLQVRLPFDPL